MNGSIDVRTVGYSDYDDDETKPMDSGAIPGIKPNTSDNLLADTKNEDEPPETSPFLINRRNKINEKEMIELRTTATDVEVINRLKRFFKTKDNLKHPIMLTEEINLYDLYLSGKTIKKLLKGYTTTTSGYDPLVDRIFNILIHKTKDDDVLKTADMYVNLLTVGLLGELLEVYDTSESELEETVKLNNDIDSYFASKALAQKYNPLYRAFLPRENTEGEVKPNDAKHEEKTCGIRGDFFKCDITIHPQFLFDLIFDEPNDSRKLFLLTYYTTNLGFLVDECLDSDNGYFTKAEHIKLDVGKCAFIGNLPVKALLIGTNEGTLSIFETTYIGCRQLMCLDPRRSSIGYHKIENLEMLKSYINLID
jgi:hypothetical protein